MLQAYFDDSGTHHGSAAVSVAGYISTPERWRVFERDWKESLDAYGIDHFRMADYESRHGLFRHWPNEKRVPRLRKLISIINRHIEFSIGSVFPSDVYEAGARPRSSLPFVIAARSCLARTVEFMRASSLPKPIAFVFERGTQGSGEVLHAYNELDADMLRMWTVGPLAFDDKKRCLPLQAADILAYELHKEIPRHRGTDKRPSRTRILELLKTRAHSWRYADEYEVRGGNDG
jgi:hypothetical protein